jgi:hypothetical protein
MHKLILSLALILTTLFALQIAPAEAQNPRSWVASYGSGTSCSRSAPCANFETALGQTNAGGEINCVDQGDFSNGGIGLTIRRSITIDCEGVQGRFGSLVSSDFAIIVGASASDVVVAARARYQRQRRSFRGHRFRQRRGSPYREMHDPQFRQQHSRPGNCRRKRQQRRP